MWKSIRNIAIKWFIQGKNHYSFGKLVSPLLPDRARAKNQRPLEVQLPKQEANTSQGYTVQHEYNKENPGIAIKDKNVEEYQKYSASYRAAYIGQGLPLVR